MTLNADIDIDVSPYFEREKYGIRAIIYDEAKERIVHHPSGCYVDCGMRSDESIPTQAVLDYEAAEALGFVKLDFLSNASYDLFDSKVEVLRLLHLSPDWSMLQDPEVCECLPQIAGHAGLLNRLKPASIDDLADVLALIRPAKRHLLEAYRKDKEAIRPELYVKTEGVYFKRSHAIAYAHMIVCVMNKLKELIEMDAV